LITVFEVERIVI